MMFEIDLVVDIDPAKRDELEEAIHALFCPDIASTDGHDCRMIAQSSRPHMPPAPCPDCGGDPLTSPPCKG